MAFHTQSGFAARCGTSRQTIKNALNRSNLFLAANGMIDDEILENAAYLRKWQQKEPGEEDENYPADQPPDLFAGIAFSNDEDNAVFREKRVVNVQKKVGNTDKYAYDLEKAAADLKKKQLDIDKLEQDLAKKRGELVPTDSVKSVVFELSRSISIAFKDGAELLITELVRMTGMDLEQQAALRARLIELINSSNQNAVNHAKSQLKEIVLEFSESRNVGQHD